MKHQNNIGWILLGFFAAIFIWFITRTVRKSVTHQLVLFWDSSTDQPPSTINAPPFQQPTGELTCAAGFALYQDKSNGNFACFKTQA